ncbi:MAG TPA: hypothetical protein VFZ23_18325 [Pyrinomonadaceae bacterium]
MFTRYIRNISKQDCPVVLSITELPEEQVVEATIQRNTVREEGSGESSEIYVRAREIYFRARRHKPVRAASIF